MELREWIDRAGQTRTRWVLKRLSANDVGRTGGHQVGLYLPRTLSFRLFPELYRPDEHNPDVFLRCSVDSHDVPEQETRVIWYNNRLRGGTRNEVRVTRWGGADSPIQDESNAGVLICIAVVVAGGATSLRVWVARDETEEEQLEAVVGIVEPGQLRHFSPGDSQALFDFGLHVAPKTEDRWVGSMPESWVVEFPKPAELAALAVKLEPMPGAQSDARLMRRRECETAMYLALCDAHLRSALLRARDDLSLIRIAAMTEFQRSKSRSGRSLELHLETVFREEGLDRLPGFVVQATTERGNRPDFLFPSEGCYHDPGYSAIRLRMLASKSTVKDRWRQVLREADRIRPKHLFTIQEGVTVPQMEQMAVEGVKLVVPAPLHRRFQADSRSQLMSLDDFVADVRTLA